MTTVIDPDPGGRKNYGSDGPGSATLFITFVLFTYDIIDRCATLNYNDLIESFW
jgi:hypothetical protein